ncbi:PIN domain-containing protein [Burkholderia stagnalis]|uniref:PIN domain-containing protein n=1 Tax=Burkholderia stagnalis TaxID=1503054 RepID=UPI000F5B9101|nr:PIN domain-containing protein [Burkholderia stagnalis]
MDTRIAAMIAANQVGAIALDTSVFDAQQRNLEGGLLRRVEQFHRSDRVRVLMPDVVKREVLTHLARDAESARTALARAVRLVTNARLLSPDAAKQCQLVQRQMEEPASAAETRLSGWLARTRAEVLDVAARVDMRALFDRYFAAQAPFAESSKKKHEFPDAAALLALEHWADEHETAVLVVSTDSDWQRFCAMHPLLIWTPNLSGALGAFQDESAQFAARRLAESIDDGTAGDLVDTLFEEGQKFLNQVGLSVDARSAFGFTWSYRTQLDGMSWPALNRALTEFEAVDHGDGTVVVRIKGKVLAKIVMTFLFSAGTGTGDASLPIGSKTMVLLEEIPCEFLVTLDADTSNRVVFRDIEFLPTSHSIVLGEIEPDWKEPGELKGWHDAFS